MQFQAAAFTSTESAVCDPLQGRVDLFENFLLIAHQVQGKLLIGVVATKLGHAGRHPRRCAAIRVQGVYFHLVHFAQKPCPQDEERIAISVDSNHVVTRKVVKPKMSRYIPG